MPIVDEHALIEENRYVGDVLADFRVGRAVREFGASRLLFKKRMFRETDESIVEPVFISLSYVQAQYDYLQARPLTEARAWRSSLRPTVVVCRRYFECLLNMN